MAQAAWVPQYREIELALRARILRMRPGDRLPSDTELCREFGVSRMTARNAMQRLAQDGLVQRIPGLGSFVVEPPAHRYADRLTAFTREMRSQGRTPRSRLLERTTRQATDTECRMLDLPPGGSVVSVRRLRLADEVPVALETAVLIRRVAAAVLGADLEAGSLHEALARDGVHLRRGEATISAEAATAEDAALLEIVQSHPLLVERRVIRDIHGRAIEATESRYPGDRYALDVRFDVEDLGAPNP